MYQDKLHPGITRDFDISGEEINFPRKTLNSRESSQPLRDGRQISFVTLHGFWRLSKNPLMPIPFPVLKGQYQAGWNANQD